MVLAMLVAVSLTLAQQPTAPATQAAPPAELSIIDARIGPCSAEFTVKDGSGTPIYAATIHVRIRYGFMGIKRMDLEVGTNSDGKARVDGLPDKGRPLLFEITKATLKATRAQDVQTTCAGMHEVTLL